MTSICRYCGRIIEAEGDSWIDPAAKGDDVIWRDSCDSNPAFASDHEPW